MSGMLGRGSISAAVLFAALACALTPALASAATISGTITADGGGPIQGVEVCPTPNPYTFEADCDETDAAGHYQLPGLPGGDYWVLFSAYRNNLRYVSEWYDDEVFHIDADPFHLGAEENATLDAALAEGGSIGGTVSDDVTHEPIASIAACATGAQGETFRCSLSNANGEYLLNGLPSGEYILEYEGNNRVSYLREVYENAGNGASATKVPVSAPATTGGIDAELAAGAQILGHVTDPTTGAPARGVFVCAMEEEPGEFQACDTSADDGSYAIRSLPAASYLVAFELEYLPFAGMVASQWWQGAATAAEADPIALAPPEIRTGIDGQSKSPFWPQERQPEPAVTVAPLPPPPVLRKPPPRKCKKGFREKRAGGKVRCVKKRQHRRAHR